ncbi:DPH4 homolog [Clavelina lepadiformis]|uniref:DPH4-like protein n=1 Tax=Clavelina lepadiformis TaxID=159417 RepID=A0ABP0F2J8_CLALP
MENLYELFELPDFSSYEIVKSRFQELARKLHPDKLVNHKESNTKEASNQFIKIKEAWNTLSDPGCKLQYDYKLKQCQNESSYTVNEVLCLEDFTLNTDFADDENDQEEVYVNDCRCGGRYELIQSDLNEMKHIPVPLIIGCSNCSLCVEVTMQ